MNHNLKKFSKYNTELNNYKCEYCKVTFRLKATLIRHVCTEYDMGYVYIKKVPLKSKDEL
jgi:hypothetical protein